MYGGLREDRNENVFARPNGLRRNAETAISCRRPRPARRKEVHASSRTTEKGRIRADMPVALAPERSTMTPCAAVWAGGGAVARPWGAGGARESHPHGGRTKTDMALEIHDDMMITTTTEASINVDNGTPQTPEDDKNVSTAHQLTHRYPPCRGAYWWRLACVPARSCVHAQT